MSSNAIFEEFVRVGSERLGPACRDQTGHGVIGRNELDNSLRAAFKDQRDDLRKRDPYPQA